MLDLNRRALLQGMGLLGAAAFVPGCSDAQAPAAATGKFFERIGKPIGLQLYALGDEAGADLGATFAMVKEMGYGEVELPGLYDRPAAEIKALADAAGLPVASLHVPAAPFSPNQRMTFESGVDVVAEAAQALGISSVVIPVPILPEGFAFGEGEDFPTAISRAFSVVDVAHWQRMATRFNELGQAMKDRGLQLAYHNHNLEFAPLGDTTPWAVLMAETDPELVKIQLDLGWVVQAGLDPAEQLRELGSRAISLHVKDVAQGGANSFYFAATPAEVGSGRIDWASLMPVAEEVGIAHYFVEQEPPFTIPRAEAMAKSARFLLDLEA